MIFAIETSCDETSTAILNLKGEILSHFIVNQENHNKFGGVVPEVASRAHSEMIRNLFHSSLNEAGIEFNLDSPKQLGTVLFDKLNLDEKASKQAESRGLRRRHNT